MQFPELSRRNFLRAAAAVPCAAAFAQTSVAKTLVYVGCYTARGQGIYIYEMNPTTGALTQVRVVGTPATLPNPSFLALSPNGRYLYSVNEIGNFEGRQSGSVRSFAVDFDNANLTEMNVRPTEGRNPAHLSVDATGRFVIAANYSGTTTNTNNVTLLPVNDDGSLEAPAQVITQTGDLGPNTGRQEAPHAHMAMPDPSGRFILVNDLGLDRTFVYRLDRAESALVSTGNPGVALPGSGPRHLAFHPNGRFLFVINELLSAISVWSWDAEGGAISRLQTISTLPDWYRGISTTAQILVSADGRFVYGSNRGHDSIAVFSCDPATGQLAAVGEHWTFGETPRNFNIDPTGNYMYVAHQNTDNIAAFKIDKTTGKLEFTGQQLLSPGQPVCIVFQTTPATGNTVKPGVTFWATNNPATAGANGRAQLTLAWNAPGTTELDIRVGGPNGVSMGLHPRYGIAATGPWVSDGIMFYLQDVSGGKPLTAENTLGTVRASVRA
ncbi:MAG: lactonase family protein [Bryobacteraceae bacterium]